MAARKTFRDRRDAGVQLAVALASYARDSPIIVALPRGGVPVGDEVAQALRVPLDVWVVRKLGAPFNPELGIGAVSEGGFVYVNEDLLGRGISSDAELARAVAIKRREVEARIALFRHGAPAPTIRGRTVIVVDDGVAMGGTARAAVRSIRALGPARLVLAVPVGAADAIESLRREVDELVCLLIVDELSAVGAWYDDFAQVSDEEVVRTLERRKAQSNPA